MDREAIQEIRTTNRLDDKLLKCKGVIGVDVEYKRVKGEKTNTFSMTVFVKKKLVAEELSADEIVPATIEGIPTDVVECLNVWPSQESSERGAAKVEAVQDNDNVLEGGQSISNGHNLGSSGTLGIVLMSSGVPTAVSCAHVMFCPPAPVQDVIEPGGVQGGTYPASKFGSVALSRYGMDNVDVALTPVVGRSSNLDSILKIGKVNGWGIGFTGNQVKKMGITTDLTFGVISSTTFTWPAIDPLLGATTLYNQIRIDEPNFALPGDSGAALVENSNNSMVGMVIGGCGGTFTVCNNSADLRNVIPPP